MTTTNEIPLPAGATRAGQWEHVFNFREQHRWFYGTARAVEGVSVCIGGYQNEGGTVRGTDRVRRCGPANQRTRCGRFAAAGSSSHRHS
jgi:hypothetical protein